MSAAAVHRSTVVPVRGGVLRVGIWEALSGGAPTRTVLLVHGITASHRAWDLVAAHLTARPGTRVVAPDLRGRGLSAGLPGPWGVEQHAEDLASVVAALGPVDVTAGHSMGAFVVVVAEHLRPGTLGSLVLVDGGVPLALPAGRTVPEVVRATLGPALERLSRTFPDRDAYRDFWRSHPAFTGAWSAAVQAYVDYDLVPAGDAWRSGTHPGAVEQDSAELFADGPAGRAWRSWTAVPPVFLRAPLGLLGEPPGLYPPHELAAFVDDHPALAPVDVDGTNHYTLVMAEPGATVVARVVDGAS